MPFIHEKKLFDRLASVTSYANLPEVDRRAYDAELQDKQAAQKRRLWEILFLLFTCQNEKRGFDSHRIPSSFNLKGILCILTIIS